MNYNWCVTWIVTTMSADTRRTVSTISLYCLIIKKMLYSRWVVVVVGHMWPTGILVLSSLCETQSALTVVPLNQVAVAGAQVTLPCTIDSVRAAASWTWYSLAGQQCQVFSGFSMGDCVDKTRYSVTSQTNGQYNLNINNTVISDAGTFVCMDLETSHAASAVYGVMGSEPKVTSNTSQSCLYEGDQVVLTCRATYSGSNAMLLSMTWTTSSVQSVSSNMTNNSATGLFHSIVFIRASTSEIPVHQCNVKFNAPTLDAVPSSVLFRPTQATNVPTYSSVATSSTYTVQYCPQTIKVTLSNGAEFAGGQFDEETVVYCNVGGGSSSVTTIYTWTNTTNGDILSNSSTVTVPIDDYTFTCTATSTVSCDMGSVKTCGYLIKTISGTAFLFDSDRWSYKSSTIALGVMFSITTLSTIALAILVVYLRRHIKGLNDEFNQRQSQISTRQRDLSDMTPCVYEQLNENSLQLNNPVIYQELANNNRQRCK